MTSAARTVYLPADPDNYLTQIAWPPKGPNDIVDCTLDASLFLADESGSGGTDTIATVGPLTLSGGITGTLVSQTATAITWTFAGGAVTSPISAYTIGVSFTTVAGNTINRNIYMQIVPPTVYQGNPVDIAVVEGPIGPQGVGVTAVAQPQGASSFCLVLSNGQETAVIPLPPGAQGDQGVGIADVVQPSPGALALILTDGAQTGTVALPAGPIGPQGMAGPQATPFANLGPSWNAATNSFYNTAGGTFSNNGGGGTASYAYPVAVAGTTTLDGISTWNLADLAVCSSTGTGTTTVWSRAPFGGSNGQTFSTLGVGTTGLILDDGTGGTDFLVTKDKAGFIYTRLTANGVLSGNGTFVSFSAGTITVQDSNGNALLATSPTAATVTLPGGLIVKSDSAGGFNVTSSDGFIVFSVGSNGYFSGTPTPGQTWLGGSSSTTFAPGDIAFYSNQGLAYSAAIAATPVAGIHRPSENLEVFAFVGASRQAGQQGSPPLSGPYLDLVMLGLSSGPAAVTSYQNGVQSTPGTYAVIGSPVLNPLQATNRSGSHTPGLITCPSGLITNATGMVVSGTTSGTYTWTGGSSVGTSFAPGTGLQLSGFQTLTAINAQNQTAVKNDGEAVITAATLTVLTSSGNTITTVEPPLATGSDGGTITLASVNYGQTIGSSQFDFFGESPDIGFARRFREAQLDALNIPLSTGYPESRVLPCNLAVSGASISQFMPGGSYWNRLPSYISQLQSSVGTTTTVALSALFIDEGDAEYAQNVSKNTYKANMLSYIESILGTICLGSGSLLNQDRPPPIYLTPTDGFQLSDTSTGTLTGAINGTLLTVSSIGTMALDIGSELSGAGVAANQYVTAQNSGSTGGAGVYVVSQSQTLASTTMTLTEFMAITMAQAELTGCTPYLNTPYGAPQQPALPNLLAAPGHFGPAHTEHSTNNGYRMKGNVLAYVHSQIVLPNGKGYRPPHLIACYFRGTQWLAIFHFPSGNGKTVSPYVLLSPVAFADWGLAPKDNAGNLTIASIQWVASNAVLLNVNRTTSAGAYPKLWGADATLHNGFINICDANPIYCEDQYDYTAGSGQCLTESMTAPQSLTSPVQNGEPLPLYQFVIPFRAPVMPG